VEANPLNHLVLSNGLEMLHSELIIHLATSRVELRLVEIRHLAVAISAEERRRAAAFPGISYL
jgi:hypothetical protein